MTFKAAYRVATYGVGLQHVFCADKFLASQRRVMVQDRGEHTNGVLRPGVDAYLTKDGLTNALVRN